MQGNYSKKGKNKMGEGDNVTQGQCDDRVNKIYERLEKVGTSVNKILGGIAVVAVVFALCIGGALYHFNYRFSTMEKSITGVAESVERVENLILY